ncbi:hypothetical protein EDD18DRAFT_1328035 [Armillaria luteobubalina]|uniref:NAD-dependent epimerase/dehydratase domain-containing protein n=1 Tax=Armillaria luteobubalina TaxID=153913 RepID=A0AA39QIJ1_9AGAR|nr:hypothetical protein EDD18DRAFT_1328035 [Armillaria luteobubalina]
MASNVSKIIFVTGGTGFIGFHVLVQLLEAGYTVRATARGKKAALLRNALGTTYDKLQVLEIPDIFSDDLSKVLQGVYGIIHLAATTPGKANAATSYRDLVIFCAKPLRLVLNCIVNTSTTVAYPPGGPYGVDVAPHFTFGPLAPGFEHMLLEPEYKALSTNGFIYALLRPDNVHFAVFPGAIDVRDVARAHLLALESPPTSVVGRKRSPLVSPYQSSYKDAIDIIAKERPELKDRLVHPSKAPEWPSYTIEVDRELVEKQIGLKVNSYIPWRDTVLDAVDSLVRIENIWKAKGFVVAVPDTPPM